MGDARSKTFNILNGLEQESMISLLLFTLYVDEFFQRQKVN